MGAPIKPARAREHPAVLHGTSLSHLSSSPRSRKTFPNPFQTLATPNPRNPALLNKASSKHPSALPQKLRRPANCRLPLLVAWSHLRWRCLGGRKRRLSFGACHKHIVSGSIQSQQRGFLRAFGRVFGWGSGFGPPLALKVDALQS